MEIFADAQFGIAIENFSHRNYFTEKLIELFLLKVVPIYWGCSNISNFFDSRGIIYFQNIDDAIIQINQLDHSSYNDRLPAIERNFSLAMRYTDFLENAKNELFSVLRRSNLI
jgi:hypothetical protein